MSYQESFLYLVLLESIPLVLFFRSFYPPFILVVFSNAIVLMKMDSHFFSSFDPFMLAVLMEIVYVTFAIVGTEYFIFLGG